MKLDQVALMCTEAQTAGGGQEIDEGKFQMAKDELTEVSLSLVTASKLLVIAMSDSNAQNLPEHLTACLTALRRITELAQDLVRFTTAPLQTRNIILKIHDVASSFREMVCVPVGPAGAGQLALNANCLANVLATLLRSLRVFSPQHTYEGGGDNNEDDDDDGKGGNAGDLLIDSSATTSANHNNTEAVQAEKGSLFCFFCIK